MKLLQSIVVAGLLAGTACQSIPPKPENVSVEPGSLSSTAASAGLDKPAAVAPELDPAVRRLKEQLSLTEQQTRELDKIYKENRAKQKTLLKELQDLNIKMRERVDAVLTQEQLEKYEQKIMNVPEHPGQPPEQPEP